ncbi:hypothetical protein D9M72_331070 [compost metagenome]
MARHAARLQFPAQRGGFTQHGRVGGGREQHVVGLQDQVVGGRVVVVGATHGGNRHPVR